MTRRMLAGWLAVIAWGAIANSCANAQAWQIGGYRPPPIRQQAPSGPFRQSPDPKAFFNPVDQGLPGATSTPQTGTDSTVGLQTGHPTTFFNYRNYFPSAYVGIGSTGMTAQTLTGPGLGGVGATGIGSSQFTPVYSTNTSLNFFQRRP